MTKQNTELNSRVINCNNRGGGALGVFRGN